MLIHEVLTALHDHLDEILAVLGGSSRVRLVALVEGLADTSRVGDHADLADELATLLRRSLPPDHPVRSAVAASEPRHGTATVDPDELVLASLRRALVRADLALTPDPEQIIMEVRQRILQAAAYSEEELRSRGGDPGGPGLIRLRRPDGEQVLPTFQFDERGGSLPVVTTVNRILRAERDPWGVADWWLERNAWLAGVPAQLLGKVPDSELIGAARAVRGDDWDA